MAIRFSCGSCGRKFSAKDSHAGRQSKCPGCGWGIIVPIPSTSAVIANGANEPPPVPTIAIGGDRKPRPENDAVLEIPDLQASPDDDVGGVQAVSYAKPMLPPSVRPSRGDPWFYGAFETLGTTVVVLASLPAAAFVLLLVAAVVRLAPWESVGIVFLFAFTSLLFFPAGAAVLLIVDVARNIRRLRLHADRNAGIE